MPLFLQIAVSVLMWIGLKDSVLKRTFTKKDFLSYIEDLISQFIYQWSYSASTQKSFDVKLLIIDVRKSGKDFKYTFLKDIEPFKTHEVKSIEQGLENSLLSLLPMENFTA